MDRKKPRTHPFLKKAGRFSEKRLWRGRGQRSELNKKCLIYHLVCLYQTQIVNKGYLM